MSETGLRMAEPCPPEIYADVAHKPGRIWLAAYTKSRHEAAVARGLQARDLQFLLPTYLELKGMHVTETVCAQEAPSKITPG